MEKLKLKFLGKDSWNRLVYKDENDNIFKDINLGDGEIDLCTSSGFDGEPDTPINYIKKYQDIEIIITGQEPEPTREEKFNYMMLGRLQSDCAYYLGYGNRNKDRLYYNDIEIHINEMIKRYNNCPINPEWLTIQQILEYKEIMLNDKIHENTMIFNDGQIDTRTKKLAHKAYNNIIYPNIGVYVDSENNYICDISSSIDKQYIKSL